MIIKAYHGTDAEFDPKDLDLSGKVYLTDNENLAGCFGSNVYEFEIEAHKPFEIDWEGCSWGGGYYPADDEFFTKFIEYASDGDLEEVRYWEETGMCVDMLASYLSFKGYDLLILHNVSEVYGFSDTEFVAMEGCAVLDGELVRSRQPEIER